MEMNHNSDVIDLGHYVATDFDVVVTQLFILHYCYIIDLESI
jgi:hypothetical protein